MQDIGTRSSETPLPKLNSDLYSKFTVRDTKEFEAVGAITSYLFFVVIGNFISSFKKHLEENNNCLTVTINLLSK